MSEAGIALLAKGALVLLLIIVGAFARALVGPGRGRGEIMLGGTLGGLSAGVLSGQLIVWSMGVEATAVSAVLGMLLGWGVAWRFARRIPRDGA